MEFRWKAWKVGVAVVAVVGSAAAVAHAASGGGSTSVEEVLSQRLPKTEITAVDCDKIDGLCEVQARQNLFYVDESGRYLVIGRVYDMDTKQDLTAARLLEMNPDMLVGGGAGDRQAAEGSGALPKVGGDPSRSRQPPSKVDPVALAALPDSGAVEMGRGSRTVTVFSDFRCGYCRNLYETLKAMNVKVVERPISVLGTRSISEAVICSSDRERAVREAYRGGSISGAEDCDTAGLDANEAFAREHGFTGTPVIVREDGVVVHGYRSKDFLQNWIDGRTS